ncbi:MAG: glycosyltransferase [Clostridia bacterium]|nr:glycosyltransferase [Clostridia bacterium]
MNDIEIICPLYNAADYILSLKSSLDMQKEVNITKINFILTESSDDSEKILKENKIPFKKILKKEFSHSKTREEAGLSSQSDILVFITQDVVIKDCDWLKKLVKPIIDGEAEASFSRQISKYNNIEKYTREKNYPLESYINTKADINKKGLNAFFFSDASSAIKTSVFKKLNGYDGKIFPTNEDMYIAHKLITNGYKIKYCSDSIVYHSHKFTFKQLYKRYYDIGVFFAQNPYLNEYGTNKAGGGLAKYVLKRALKEFNIKVLFRFLPDMLLRWLGFKKGKKNFCRNQKI